MLTELQGLSFLRGGSFTPQPTLDETWTMVAKKQDLAGPGIGNYDELEKILPADYSSLLTPKETQKAIFAVKKYIEENLCKELNLMMVTVPLIVDVESGVIDLLDRDGSRTPIHFHISNDHNTSIPSARKSYRRQPSGSELH